MRLNRQTIPILTLAAILLLSGCEQKSTESAAAQTVPQAMSTRVELPLVRKVTDWHEFTGRFQAVRRVELRARVSGYLEEIRFEDGQIVQKNDLLFVIDQRPYKIALDSAQARFNTANNEFKRVKKLLNTQAVSQEIYDQRLQDMRTAKATLDAARLELTYTEIKAPFTGRISNNRIDVGNLVSSSENTILTTIVTISPIEFYFEGSETDLLSYIRARENGKTLDNRAKGLAVYVRLQDETDYVHEGKINFIDNELDNDTSTILARAIFDNEQQILEPGMFGRMRLATEEPADAMLIPQGIIGTEQTRKYVYVLDTENKAIRKYVTLGKVTDDGLRVIRSGIDRNDRIIVGNLQKIQPGMLIAPIESIPNALASKENDPNQSAETQ